MQIQGEEPCLGWPFPPNSQPAKNIPFVKGPSAQQTLRALGDLRKVQQGETSSTSSTVLMPECSHCSSCEQKRLLFRPRTPGETLPFHPQGSSTTYSFLLLSPGMASGWQPVQGGRITRCGPGAAAEEAWVPFFPRYSTQEVPAARARHSRPPRVGLLFPLLHAFGSVTGRHSL